MSATELAPNRYARAEREALCDLLQEVGPEAPTLCEGWVARDLASHLVIREGRNPIVGAGIAVSFLSGVAAKAQAKKAAQPWPVLVEEVRVGPPKGSMMRSPKMDGTINTIEYFIHHEDVRRAQPGWAPRALSPEFSQDLWERLEKFAKRITRNAPVGVIAQRPDGATLTLNEGPTPVTIVGEPGEILVYLYRRDHAQIEVKGEPAEIETLLTALREGSI